MRIQWYCSRIENDSWQSNHNGNSCNVFAKISSPLWKRPWTRVLCLLPIRPHLVQPLAKYSESGDSLQKCKIQWPSFHFPSFLSTWFNFSSVLLNMVVLSFLEYARLAGWNICEYKVIPRHVQKGVESRVRTPLSRGPQARGRYTFSMSDVMILSACLRSLLMSFHAIITRYFLSYKRIEERNIVLCAIWTLMPHRA